MKSRKQYWYGYTLHERSSSLCQGRWGYRRVVAAFGRRYVLPSGELDRVALGEAVFGDAAARRRLNAATHPAVTAELVRQLLLHWLKCTLVVVRKIKGMPVKPPLSAAAAATRHANERRLPPPKSF